MFGYNKERLITVETSPSVAALKRKLRGEEPVQFNISSDIAYTKYRIKKFEERYGCDMTFVRTAVEKFKGRSNEDISLFFEYDRP